MDRRFLLLEFFDALSFHENAHTCVGFAYSQAGLFEGNWIYTWKVTVTLLISPKQNYRCSSYKRVAWSTSHLPGESQ